MLSPSTRFALNPLQWVATDDGWINPGLAPPLAERFARIAAAGFSAVHTDLPSDGDLRAYAATLADNGLVAGPGYTQLMWLEDEGARKQFVERARTVAAGNAALGIDVVFLSMAMNKEAPRVAHPAVGYDFRQDRLERVRDYLAEAAAAMRAEGVAPALHPHVGTYVETEAEARFVLDSVDADILKFGPDSGHLSWTGADPADLITHYRDRVVGIHVKDFVEDVAQRSRRDDIDYRSTVTQGLWTEPGYGDADIGSVLSALGPDYSGWVVVEVDRGSTQTPEESVDRCGAWIGSLGVKKAAVHN